MEKRKVSSKKVSSKSSKKVGSQTFAEWELKETIRIAKLYAFA